MTVEENKQLARRFFEFETRLASGLDPYERVLDEFLTTDFRAHIPGQPDMSLDDFREALLGFVDGFPNFEVSIHDQIADDDTVVTRATFSGRQTGEFDGIPPTGNTVSVDEVVILRVKDQRIAELWGVFDNFTILDQLGVVDVRRERK